MSDKRSYTLDQHLFNCRGRNICVPALHNEAEVGNLASEILMNVLKLAKFMAFFYLPYFHPLEVSRYYRTFKTVEIPKLKYEFENSMSFTEKSIFRKKNRF